MTRDVAIAILKEMKPIQRRADGKSTTHILQTMALEMAIRALEQRWIPVKTRPITPDEIEEFGWEDRDESWMWMYDCELPDDGQEVLIQSEYGIDFTTFYNEGSEGCYFENYEDVGDVIAWMPLPEPYKEVGG